MRGQERKIKLIGCFVCALLWLAPLAAQQDQQPANQQQRPRKVGSTSTNANASPTDQQQKSSAEEVSEGDVVRVETQLVTVPAVVTDRNGHPLTDLRAEDFVVLEDGKAERLTNFATTETPFEIALLLDTSGSTREELGLIRDAANAFLSALRAGDRVAIIGFNNSAGANGTLAAVEVLSPLTDKRTVLRSAIATLGTSNGTPFYDALSRVAEEVFRDPPTEQFRGRRAVVALTDGVDSTSNSDYNSARAKLIRAGVAT